MKKSLLTKTMLLLCALITGSSSAWAIDVTYTISSKNTLTTTGTAPTGSSASIVETYSTSKQMTSGNSQTLTLTCYSGYKITQIKLSMKSNASSGAGKLSYSTDNGANYTYIVGSSTEGVAFNNTAWHGSWSSSYVDVTKSDLNISCGASNAIIKVEATANSLYCQSYTLTYEADDTRTATTVTIDASGITNTNKYTGTDAGSLTATVKTGETPIDGANVTWSSAEESVATINSTTGAVTLVGEGSTIITASYAGNVTYKPSSNTYTLNVTNENPAIVTIWSEDFSDFSADGVPNGGTNSYVCTNGEGTTKVYTNTNAGGTSPELLIGKSGGTFTATIPLQTSTYAYSGDLILTYKTNANSLNVKTTTDGITVDGEEKTGDGKTFNTSGTHKITFKGVTTSTENITIVFTTTTSSNVRIDDIVLKGVQEALTKVVTPVITPVSGAVASGTEVTITCLTDGVTIYYTTDGSTPTSSSTAYNPSSKPTITTATTIKAIAIKDGLTDSDIAEAAYTIAEPCATPTFSVAAGAYSTAQSVTISCATDGAAIYYTTDGTEPTTSSTAYSSAISLNTDKTLKAIAVKDGYVNSTIAEATYIFYTALPFSWAGGTSAGLTALTGVTASGLGNDYADSNAPYRIKMDGADDYIQIKTNAQAAQVGMVVCVGIKMLGGATTSKIKVQESADGETFTDVQEFEISGKQNDILNFATTTTLKAASRYVRIIKSVHGSNIGVGPISIAIPEPAEPTTSGDEVYLTTTDNMEGWRTFFDASQAYTVDANTTVYAAQADGGKIKLVAFDDGIPANTPVILHTSSSTDSHKMTLTKAGSVTAVVPANILKATTAASTDLSAGTYRLGYKSTNGVGFYNYASATAPAGIVYIWKTDVNGPAPGFVDFEIGDDNTEGETTGIDKVRGQKEEVRGEFYNLNGQRVAQPTKGLYIVNGKKVIIK